MTARNYLDPLKECLRAAADLDEVIFRLSRSSVDRSRALMATFSKMHELATTPTFRSPRLASA
jgi:hypothetical protein